MPRRPTEESLDIAAFAKRYNGGKGCTLQYARRQRAENTRAWQDYLAGKKERKAIATVHLGTGEGQVSSPASESDRARVMVEATWTAFESATRNLNEAFARDADAAEMSALQRAVREARKTYEDACTHEKMVGLDARRYIPLASVRAIRSAMPMLAEVVQNLRANVAGRMPQEMRKAFYDAFDTQRAAFNEGMRKIDAYIESLLPENA